MVFALLPREIVVCNDDFGYLRSVIETLQRGRPWTDDWLEPWSASLSVIVSLVYLVVGNFHLAVHGTLAALGGISFYMLCCLLLQRGFRNVSAIAVASLLLTSPTVLWKSVEFTSIVIYLPCLLAAVWAVESRRWWLFGLVWMLAVTSRQSALTWLIMPGWEILQILRRREAPRGIWFPLLLCGGGALFFWWFGTAMNTTHAQAMITQHLFSNASATTISPAVVAGILVFLIAAGWGGAARQLQADHPWQQRLPHTAALVLILAGAALFFAGTLFQAVGFEHAGYAGGTGSLYLKLAILLAAAGWLTGGLRISTEKMIWALGSLVPLCLRPELWDYYFLDVAVFGFLGIEAPPTPAGSGSPLRWISRSLVAGVAALQLGTTWLIKLSLDDADAKGRLAEHAMRTGTIKPAELGFVPFGFRGWYLHKYHILHEGAKDPNIAGLQRYVDGKATVVAVRYNGPPWLFPGSRKHSAADLPGVITTESHPVGWFFSADYRLLRRAPASAVPINESVFSSPSFPLNDAEWRDLIEHKFIYDLRGVEIGYAQLRPNQQAVFRTLSPRPERFYSAYGLSLYSSEQPGRERLSTNPDTKFWFALTPGRHRLRTDIDIAAAAWQNVPAADASDGVTLVIAAVFDDKRREILQSRYLNPRDNPADRGPQSIDWTFTLPPGAKLEVTIDPGPTGSGARDWCSLGPLSIERASADSPDGDGGVP